ncbi:hypothetical protein FACS1894166_07000 [Bacilli bacterium]|nr:hypothetical protein FACS1894166_07000 [Bacilli bacterium]
MVEKNKKHELSNQFILKYLEKAKISRAASLIVPDIEYLKKGGRISNFKSLLVKMFGFKLIITLNVEGLIFRNKSMSTKEAVKKMKSELNKLVDLDHREIKRCVMFTNAMNNKKFNIAELMELAKNEFPNTKFEQAQLPAVITAHVGPNYMAVGTDVE